MFLTRMLLEVGMSLHVRFIWPTLTLCLPLVETSVPAHTKIITVPSALIPL